MGAEARSDELCTQIQNCSQDRFEEYIAELWNARGWQTELSPLENNNGREIIAKKPDGVPPKKIAIWPKQPGHGDQIELELIQQYYELKQADATFNEIVVITPKSFTPASIDWANENGVRLVNGRFLVNLTNELQSADFIHQLEPIGNVAHPPQTEPSDTTHFPRGEALNSPNRKVKIVAVLGVFSGVGVLVGPWNTAVAIDLFGAGILLISGLVLFYTLSAFDVLTAEQPREPQSLAGGVVTEQNSVVKYIPWDDRPPVEFDAFDDLPTQRQQAITYAVLDQRFDHELSNVSRGYVPNAVESAGGEFISAYLFAVHDRRPENTYPESDGLCESDQ
ncbi:restriction endonuclease [Haladaptatus sp. DJG-WS-42]|uniref:restriction endonuclease n=1 Tax=Haladaptatus sp. DJG-WS-42 TaxID=3120516 RepID=UPI0030D4560D